MCAPEARLPRWFPALCLTLAAAGPPARALGEKADVYLRDGTALRGDVELTETEAIIRTLAGPIRCPREKVERINWLEPPATPQADYLRRLWSLATDDVAGHLALARWLVEQRLASEAAERCRHVLQLAPGNAEAQALLRRLEQPKAPAASRPATQPTSAPARATRAAGPELLPPPPLLSRGDLLRIKLAELNVDGPAERVSVRFRKHPGQPRIEELIRQEMVKAPDYDPAWDLILERGRPWEKLQLMLRTSGLKHADRVELRGHPEKFVTYRRRVLPLVIRGCVRSGCHGGREGYGFRFPTGSQTSEAFVYTTFVILDRIQTPAGPMIDRDLPEQSALVRYMLPVEQGGLEHPPVERGRVVPVLRGTSDPRYRLVVEWIATLRSPHPDYELEYEFPAWLQRLSRWPRPEPGSRPGEPAAGTQPAGTRAAQTPPPGKLSQEP